MSRPVHLPMVVGYKSEGRPRPWERRMRRQTILPWVVMYQALRVWLDVPRAWLSVEGQLQHGTGVLYDHGGRTGGRAWQGEKASMMSSHLILGVNVDGLLGVHLSGTHLNASPTCTYTYRVYQLCDTVYIILTFSRRIN